MLQRNVILAAFLLSSVSALAAPSTDPMAAPGGLYDADPTHTSVTFTIGHMGLSAYAGRINGVTGKMGFDPKFLESSKLDIEIDLTSVDTPSDKLDEKLKNDFFKTASFPKATFRSSKAKRTGPTSGTITGELNLAGVTKPVTLAVTFNGGTLHPFRNTYALGFDATATIKRSDFGLDKVDWSPFVSDEVKLTIAAEFFAEK